ncbi:hypothetical protein Hanom_Chr07g00602251 [Helianthus anomalus]
MSISTYDHCSLRNMSISKKRATVPTNMNNGSRIQKPPSTCHNACILRKHVDFTKTHWPLDW